jgi:hypothetical protein
MARRMPRPATAATRVVRNVVRQPDCFGIRAYRGLRRQQQHARLFAVEAMRGVLTATVVGRLVRKLYGSGAAQAEVHDDSSTSY